MSCFELTPTAKFAVERRAVRSVCNGCPRSPLRTLRGSARRISRLIMPAGRSALYLSSESHLNRQSERLRGRNYWRDASASGGCVSAGRGGIMRCVARLAEADAKARSCRSNAVLLCSAVREDGHDVHARNSLRRCVAFVERPPLIAQSPLEASSRGSSAADIPAPWNDSVVDVEPLSGSAPAPTYTLSGFLTMPPVRSMHRARLTLQFSSWIMTQSGSSWIYFDLPQTYTTAFATPTTVTATQNDSLVTLTYPAAATLTTGCAFV